jgi:hypothetical protein
MSEEVPVGLKIGEKFFGLLIMLIGFLVFYFSYTSLSSLGTIIPYPDIFPFVGAVLMVVGLLLIFARLEEE